MSKASFLIAPEEVSDTPLIDALLDDAFGLERRTKTAYRLREGSEPADALSFAAWNGDSLVGTIRFWPLWIDNRWQALLLGPLAVSLDFRGNECGIALMQHGLEAARELGHQRVVLVGDEPYYSKVGFRRAGDGMLSMPGPVDPERLLVLELVEEAMAGVSGLIASPLRSSAALAEPGETEQGEECRQAEQG